MKVLGVCIAVLVGQVFLLSSLAAGQTASAPSDAEIQRLIRQLGSERWTLREEATQRLIEIGLPAVPAVRQASLGADLEVSLRCKLILKGAVLDRAKRLALEKAGQAAFLDGNYAAMAAAYARLVASGDAAELDYLWLGHARQLGGDWGGAVSAYGEVVRRLDEEIAAAETLGPEKRISPLAPAEAESEAAGPPARDMTMLVHRRNLLVKMLGLMRREEANDLPGAAATFRGGLDHWGRYRDGKTIECVREWAVTLERMGKPREAIGAWMKLVELMPHGKEGYHWMYSVESVARLLGRLPTKDPLPSTPGLIVLTPRDSDLVLDLDDPNATALACSRHPPFWRYALAPPPGMEFEKIAFACDIEQLKERYGGHFTCWSPAEGRPAARVSIGRISWPTREPIGRKTIRAEFAIFPGADVVLFETGSSPGAFNVHTVEITASLRPRTMSAKPPQPGVSIQNEVLPAGGTLTWNDKPWLANSAAHDLAPGRYRIAYDAPGRKETFRCDADLLAGRKYGLLINLDSPFRWESTDAAFQPCGLSLSTAVARLPDGRWLAAYVPVSGQMMLSTSKDLKAWDKPRPMPGGSICMNYPPSLLADEDGTVWMAHFSTRLQLGKGSDTDYRLWLSSTRDGRTWTPPRTVSLGQPGGTAADPVHLFRGPDGRCRLFWHNQAGEANSMHALRELKDLGLVDAARTGYAGVHVAVGEKGVLHMVFAGPDGGLHYSVLADPNGTNWSPPVRLVAKEGKDSLYSPQMIVDGGRFALIYEQAANTYLRRGAFSDLAALSLPVKIANFVGPVGGARAVVTKEGRVALLAGNDGHWLLTADKKDLLTAPKD